MIKCLNFQWTFDCLEWFQHPFETAFFVFEVFESITYKQKVIKYKSTLYLIIEDWIIHIDKTFEL